jgi:hypothetical protein
MLEIEHDHVVALGGSKDLCNLKLYCRSHNLYQAQIVFGRSVMEKYTDRAKYLLDHILIDVDQST